MTTAVLTAEDLRRMMSPVELARLTAELGSDMKDKSYELLPLGQDAAAYLRLKRKRLSDHSMDAYESTLNNFCRTFAYLELKDFEPPIGTERIEEWLDEEWGRAQPATYNRHLSVLRDFFKVQVMRGNLIGDPMLVIEPAKKREVYRETYSEDQVRAVIASADVLRDRVALRLLLHYAIRRGTLQKIQFKHFDHNRLRLAKFLKGGKVRYLPIPEQAFWHDLERHIIEAEAQPNHYLMTARWKNRYGFKDKPEKPMSFNGIQKWWYRRLVDGGIVEEGTTSGEKMHKARHTAAQRILDVTGNLKAVQMALDHENINTTAKVYVDWDERRMAQTFADVYPDE